MEPNPPKVSPTTVKPFSPYQPRRLFSLGLSEVAGYRLKLYSVLYTQVDFRPELLESGLAVAAKTLPQPAIGEGRPGVGFVILHQGRTGNYFILCWWDRENELPTRIFLHDAQGWRPAVGGESYCVWDLHVIWQERKAYVATALDGRPEGIERYLACVAEGPV